MHHTSTKEFGLKVKSYYDLCGNAERGVIPEIGVE